MKKFLWFLLLCVPFLFLTCAGDKNVSLRYDLEKTFNLGEQFRENLYINLQAATPEDYQKAISYYQVVKEKSPFPKKKKDLDSLDQDSRDVLRLTQQSYIRISELLINQKKLDQALSEANSYLADFQKNDFNRQMMRLRKGQIYELQQKPDSALAEYELTLQEYVAQHDPANPVGDFLTLPIYIISLHMKAKDFSQQTVDQAALFYKSLIASPPVDPLSQQASSNLAELYLRNNEFDRAISTLETLVDSAGKIYPQPLFNIADLYLVGRAERDKSGRTINRYQNLPKSRQTFNRLVELYPDNELTPFAKFGVGRTYYAEKQYQKALDVFSEVKQKYPQNPRAVAATQFQIGLTYVQIGNWDRAKTELDWLIINYPDSPEGMKAVGFIADYYSRNNNKAVADAYYQKAIDQYKGIIAKDPKSQQAYAANQMLTEVYLTLERWQEAATQLEDFVKNNPGNTSEPDVLLLMGQLYEEKLNDKAKANQSYAMFLVKYPQDPRAKEAMERAKKLSLEMQEQGKANIPK